MIEFFIIFCLVCSLNCADPSCNNNTTPIQITLSDSESKIITIPSDTSSIADRRPRRSATSLCPETKNKLEQKTIKKVSFDDSAVAFKNLKKERNSIQFKPTDNAFTEPQIINTNTIQIDNLWGNQIVTTYNELDILPYNIYTINYLASKAAKLNKSQIEDHLNENKNPYKDNPKKRAHNLLLYILGYNSIYPLFNRTQHTNLFTTSSSDERAFLKGIKLMKQISDPLLHIEGKRFIQFVTGQIKYHSRFNAAENSPKISSPAMIPPPRRITLTDEFAHILRVQEAFDTLRHNKQQAERKKINDIPKLLKDAEIMSKKPANN